MYPEIKINAIRKGKHLYQVAHELGWSSSKLSQIISGIHPANSDERRQLAKYYDRPVSELFRREAVHA
jgi:transcriptional regulator with XRE-family HTH domain